MVAADPRCLPIGLMRVLVTGREGQVARAIADLRLPDVHFAGRPLLDLARPESIAATIEAVRPDIIVSAAAWTDVDAAEDAPGLAMAINATAPGLLGAAAARIGARVIHLSTDHVFDGSGRRGWREEDPVSPVNAYGQSKALGEQALRAATPDHLILRTAWVYSPQGDNFVTRMLRLGRERQDIGVVADQHGCPTSAADIARALVVILAHWHSDPGHGLGMTCHFAGSGATSRAGLAREAFRRAARHGHATPRVRNLASRDYPCRAQRPANGRLNCDRFASLFGYRAPPWQDSLAQVIDQALAGR